MTTVESGSFEPPRELNENWLEKIGEFEKSGIKIVFD